MIRRPARHDGKAGERRAMAVAVGSTGPNAVIAGLDPAIPIVWHGCTFLSGMAGSSTAMTTGKTNML